MKGISENTCRILYSSRRSSTRINLEARSSGEVGVVGRRSAVATLALAMALGAIPVTAGLPAFPGAEGGGALAVGGRGGKVCRVTNLDDSGPGSLRDCIAREGPRTVIFDVGGTIELKTGILITNPYLTIAGQTAPGDGIQIKADQGDPGASAGQITIYNTHDVVIRYLRLRKGYTAEKRNNIRVIGNSKNVILDHLSLFWAENQNWSTYTWGSTSAPNNITLQNSIVTEMLNRRVNILIGASNAAGAALSTNIDHHNNLIANSGHRNPSAQQGSGRWVNNIIYNYRAWASRSIGGVRHDWVSNLWKPGPEEKSSRAQQELHFVKWTEDYQDPERIIRGAPSLYVVGNRGLLSGMSPDTDNWPYTREAGPNANGYVIGPTPEEWRRTTPLPANPVPITARHVDELEEYLLPIVGASRRLDCDGRWVPNRDGADQRVIDEYINNLGTLTMRGEGEEIYGGHPTLASGESCKDTSGDGIPDEWAVANGLDPRDPSLGATIHDSGYTYLEMYLNGLEISPVAPAAPAQIRVD